jgi:hypothetical protein
MQTEMGSGFMAGQDAAGARRSRRFNAPPPAKVGTEINVPSNADIEAA